MSLPVPPAEVCGIPINPLSPGWVPLEAIVILRCLDEDGNVALAIRTTGGLYVWEKLGLLRAALLREEQPEDEDDDPDAA